MPTLWTRTEDERLHPLGIGMGANAERRPLRTGQPAGSDSSVTGLERVGLPTSPRRLSFRAPWPDRSAEGHLAQEREVVEGLARTVDDCGVGILATQDGKPGLLTQNLIEIPQQ